MQYCVRDEKKLLLLFWGSRNDQCACHQEFCETAENPFLIYIVYRTFGSGWTIAMATLSGMRPSIRFKKFDWRWMIFLKKYIDFSKKQLQSDQSNRTPWGFLSGTVQYEGCCYDRYWLYRLGFLVLVLVYCSWNLWNSFILKFVKVCRWWSRVKISSRCCRMPTSRRNIWSPNAKIRSFSSKRSGGFLLSSL